MPSELRREWILTESYHEDRVPPFILDLEILNDSLLF